MVDSLEQQSTTSFIGATATQPCPWFLVGFGRHESAELHGAITTQSPLQGHKLEFGAEVYLLRHRPHRGSSRSSSEDPHPGKQCFVAATSTILEQDFLQSTEML